MGGDKMGALLQAAARVIGEKGYAQTRMADIAEAAGIGKGTIYEYCKSKEELLERLMEYHLEQAGREMAHGALPADPLEALKALVRRGLAVMAGMEETITLTIDFWSVAFKNRESKIFLMLRKLYGELVGFVEQIVRSGQQAGTLRADCDARSFAMIVFSVLDESFMHAIFEGRGFDPVRFEEELCRLIEGYLSVRPAKGG